MKTKWQSLKYECCPQCGSDDIQVLTDTGKDNYACDGDEVRCYDCRCFGGARVDEDGSLWVQWHNNPDCKCEWCQMARAKEVADILALELKEHY